jgi:hypothetical protein
MSMLAARRPGRLNPREMGNERGQGIRARLEETREGCTGVVWCLIPVSASIGQLGGWALGIPAQEQTKSSGQFQTALLRRTQDFFSTSTHPHFIHPRQHAPVNSKHQHSHPFCGYLGKSSPLTLHLHDSCLITASENVLTWHSSSL